MEKNIKKIDKLLDDVTKKDQKIEDFKELLEGLKDLDSKKKILWKEIYENAINDRERASILFTEAYQAMSNNLSDHVTLGSTMVKYLERMSKSNDQILSLADLISKAEKEQNKIEPDELYSQMLDD